MKVALAQINPVVGAVEDNAQKIIKIIKQYSSLSDLIIFPEMCLTGYPPKDLLFNESFLNLVDKYVDSIAKIVTHTPIIFGTVRKDNKKIYNTAVVMQNKKILSFHDKTHLPTYDVFDEKRYFSPSKSRTPVKIKINKDIVTLGIHVCEDLWDEAYDMDICKELVSQGTEILVNISASPFYIDKASQRIDIASAKARELKCYFIYCNLIGGQDELVFDGQSFAIDANGKLIDMLPDFEEHVKVLNTQDSTSVFFNKHSEEEQIFKAISLGVSDYFKKSGYKKAVIGLSGGIDSALTGFIAAHALGAKNIIGVSMPSDFSSAHSIDDAKQLAKNLNINFEIIPINAIYNKMLKELSPFFKGTEPGLAEENMQARIRANLLMAIANKNNALLLNTGNKTETALGYCTIYGDMAGALAVISDLTKTQVYSISNWINNNLKNSIIPQNSISKLPSAELRPNQVDPFDYEIVSPIVERIVSDPSEINNLIEEGNPSELVLDLCNKIHSSEYKRVQSAPGIKISQKAFGSGRRYPIVNHYNI